MNKTKRHNQWVRWLIQNRRYQTLTKVVNDHPDWLTTETADMLVTENGAVVPDLNTKVNATVYAHVSETVFDQLIKQADPRTLLQLSEHPRSAGRVPYETREQLARSPYPLIRLSAATSEHYTRRQRLTAAAAVTATKHSNVPDTTEERWYNKLRLGGPGSGRRTPTIWELGADAVNKLGPLTEPEKEMILTSPLLPVASAGWKTFHGTSETAEFVSHTRFVELLRQQADNIQHLSSLLVGLHPYPSQVSHIIEYGCRLIIGGSWWTHTLKQYIRYLTEDVLVLAYDNELLPSQWGQNVNFVKDTQFPEGLRELADRVERYSRNERQLFVDRLPTLGIKGSDFQTTIHEHSTKYPKTATTQKFWESTTRILVTSGPWSSDYRQWGPTLTSLKPDWEWRHLVRTAQHQHDQNLETKTNTLITLLKQLAEHRHFSDRKFRELLTGTVDKLWSDQKIGAYPVLENLLELMGPDPFVTYCQNRAPARLLVQLTPEGVENCLSRNYPDIDLGMFLTVAYHPDHKEVTLTEICGIL